MKAPYWTDGRDGALGFSRSVRRVVYLKEQMMGSTRIFHGCIKGGVALACVWLTACTTPPLGTPETPAQTSAAGAPASAAAADTMSADMRSQLTELRKDLTEAGVTVGETPEGRIRLNIPSDISFGMGRSTVSPSFAKVLNVFADNLNKHPNTAIEIVGHTDNTGTDAINLPLSKQRADGTRDYLVGRQVAAERFSTQGWGPDQPIADNKTAKGRAMNRRVEVFVADR
jgi:outer membrane protein OmpA-like peptidoglycan-associated protein